MRTMYRAKGVQQHKGQSAMGAYRHHHHKGCRRGKTASNGRLLAGGRRGGWYVRDARAAAAAAADAGVEFRGEQTPDGSDGGRKARFMAADVFGGPREVGGIGAAAASLPFPLRAAASVAMVAGGAAVASSMLPSYAGSAVKYGAGSLVGGAIGAGASFLVERERQRAAKGLMHNRIIASVDAFLALQDASMAMPDLQAADTQEFEDDASKYYDAFLSRVIPEADEPLEGDEVMLVRAFKESLGLEEQIAAAVHMDVGQRILRMRMEGDTKTGDSDALRRFQKLVFVSQQLFGEQKARFLLPWRRRCGFTDAQVKVAMREIGSKLFMRSLDAVPTESFFADVAQMRLLKDARESLDLDAATAAALVRAAARRQVEGIIRPAVEMVKSRSSAAKDADTVADIVSRVLDLDALSVRLAAENPDLAEVGAGPILLRGGSGGVFDTPAGAGDLRDLFRNTVSRTYAKGFVSDEDVSRMIRLRTIFGMDEADADAIILDETRKTYEAELRRAVADGSLDAAESKAKFLQVLCEKIRFDPSAALAYNGKLYQQKLSSLVKSGKISDKDNEDLIRMRVLLCIAADTAERAQRDICSKPYLSALKQSIASGADSFGDYALQLIRTAQANMRLTNDLAFELMAPVVKKEMMSFIQRSRNAKEKGDGAMELQNLVVFNQRVVTPIVDDLRPPEEKEEEAAKQIAELIKEAQEMTEKEEAADADSKEEENKEGDSSAGEMRAAAEGAGFADAADSKKDEEEAEEKKDDSKGSFSPVRSTMELRLKAKEGEFIEMTPQERYEMAKSQGLASNPKAKALEAQVARGQNTVTLQTELTLADRKEFYRKYFMRTIEGEYVDGPMGLKVQVQRDMSVTMKQLNQFADLMGLSANDVAGIQRDFSESAYKAAAERILGTKTSPDAASAGQLKEMQGQLGISDEDAQRIVKQLTGKKVMSGLKQQVAQGNVSLETIKQMKMTGMDVEKSVGKPARMTIFKKAVENALSTGTGDVKTDALRVSLIDDLALEREKAQRDLNEIAGNRKKDAMVQAVSFLRQQRREDSIKALNNLIACAQFVPEPVDWSMRGEKEDLFMMYVRAVKDDAKRKRLAAAFDISDEDANVLIGTAGSASDGGSSVVSSGAQETSLF